MTSESERRVMTEPDQVKDTTLRGDFWTALSIELALRGLHPDLEEETRLRIEAERTKRSWVWFPVDVAKRLAAIRIGRAASGSDQ